MPELLNETLRTEFADFANWPMLLQVAIRLAAAALAGGVIGFEREAVGKAAGLRTHMLVTIGAALFVIVPVTQHASEADVSRVIQGIVTGIGFLGGGAILKSEANREIHGLTTAAGIWMAAAIGVAVGFGRLGVALLATILALAVLQFLGWIERGFNPQNNTK